MILKILLLTLLCIPYTGNQDNGPLIPWSVTRKLAWSDFKAPPPPGATNAALTSSSILMKFRSDGEKLTYYINCNFEPATSWGRVKNDHILLHEQGHFDIAEIHARKLNQALKAYYLRNSTLSQDVNAIYQSVMNELKQMQEEYDQQSDHSRNTAQQKSWTLKIENLLTSLNAYADYLRA